MGYFGTCSLVILVRCHSQNGCDVLQIRLRIFSNCFVMVDVALALSLLLNGVLAFALFGAAAKVNILNRSNNLLRDELRKRSGYGQNNRN